MKIHLFMYIRGVFSNIDKSQDCLMLVSLWPSANVGTIPPLITARKAKNSVTKPLSHTRRLMPVFCEKKLVGRQRPPWRRDPAAIRAHHVRILVSLVGCFLLLSPPVSELRWRGQFKSRNFESALAVRTIPEVFGLLCPHSWPQMPHAAPWAT